MPFWHFILQLRALLPTPEGCALQQQCHRDRDHGHTGPGYLDRIKDTGDWMDK